MKKAFSATIGVLLALFVIFIAVPLTVTSCVVCAGAASVESDPTPRRWQPPPRP